MTKDFYPITPTHHEAYVKLEDLDPQVEASLLGLPRDEALLRLFCDNPAVAIDEPFVASLNELVVTGSQDLKRFMTGAFHRDSGRDETFSAVKQARRGLLEGLGWYDPSHIMNTTLTKLAAYDWGGERLPKTHNIIQVLRLIHGEVGDIAPSIINRRPQLLATVPDLLEKKLDIVNASPNNASTILICRPGMFGNYGVDTIGAAAAKLPDLSAKRQEIIDGLSSKAEAAEAAAGNIAVASVLMPEAPKNIQTLTGELAGYTDYDQDSLLQIARRTAGGTSDYCDASLLHAVVDKARCLYESGDDMMTLRQIGLHISRLQSE